MNFKGPLDKCTHKMLILTLKPVGIQGGTWTLTQRLHLRGATKSWSRTRMGSTEIGTGTPVLPYLRKRPNAAAL